MKLSTVIKELTKLHKKHGDVITTIYSDKSEKAEDIHGFAVATEDGYDSKVIELNICAKNTSDAFMANAQEAIDA